MAIYTCVLLDVDNTLLDFDAAERQALTDMLAEYELPHDEAAYDTYHKVNRELWDSLAKGQLNKQKLFQIRFSRFMQAMQLPDNGKGKAMNDRYEELLERHKAMDCVCFENPAMGIYFIEDPDGYWIEIVPAEA